MDRSGKNTTKKETKRENTTEVEIREGKSDDVVANQSVCSSLEDSTFAVYYRLDKIHTADEIWNKKKSCTSV